MYWVRGMQLDPAEDDCLFAEASASSAPIEGIGRSLT